LSTEDARSDTTREEVEDEASGFCDFAVSRGRGRLDFREGREKGGAVDGSWDVELERGGRSDACGSL
jgi:hypothetical protein